LDISAYLIDEIGVNIDEINEVRQTALHLACDSNSINNFKFLIQKGANLEARDINGLSPLLYACKVGNLEAVKYLLNETNANIEAVSNDRKNLLRFAIERGNEELVNFVKEKRKPVCVMS